MGVHNREYKGIQFTIHTSETRGRWSWSYTLGTEFHELREKPCHSEFLAISEAEHEAHCLIDQGAGKSVRS
jgi:hypothetical protein